MDIILALTLMVFLSPLALITAIIIKIESKGPVIFKQTRIGENMKPFRVYKFRSMRMHDPKKHSRYTLDNDARVTKFGKFMRKTRIDELPQLWNVFKGDMSFIGPRPERRFYIEQIMAKDARYEQLYALRPGVTSYATLYNGYADSIEKMLKRLELDLYYLQNRSWWMDTRILACTFFKIAGGKKF